jgi:hypothetical protein
MSIDDDFDDDLEGEVEVNIDPREDELDARGIAHEDFETALFEALDKHSEALETDDGDVTRPLEEVQLTIKGQTYRLGDLADVTIEEEPEEEFDI